VSPRLHEITVSLVDAYLRTVVKRTIVQLPHIVVATGAGRVKRNGICWASHYVKFRIVVFGKLWIRIVVSRTRLGSALLRIDEWLEAEAVFGLFDDLGWY
jgi:hypothetical protein